jgi:hypothetical protein
MPFSSFRLFALGAAVAALPFVAAGCGPAETTATAYFTWEIDDAASDPNTAPALTCDQKGVTTVRIELVPSVPNGIFDAPCANMAAETYTVPSGTYTIDLIALGSTFQALAQLSFQQRLFGRTNLGHIKFQVH